MSQHCLCKLMVRSRNACRQQLLSTGKRIHGNGDRPDSISTTTTETVDSVIGFGFATLIVFHALRLTPPRGMSPKHPQSNARPSRQSSNAYNALADLAQDGTTSNLIARDGRIDEVDGYSTGMAVQKVVLARSPDPSATPHKQPATTTSFQDLNQSYEDTNDLYDRLDCDFDMIHDALRMRNNALQVRFDFAMLKLDHRMGENTALQAAYASTQAQVADLTAAVDALTKETKDQHVNSVPPSPTTTPSSAAMEEVTMQLSVVQNDIQDVLDAVRNLPGKTKRRGSDQNTEPTSPTYRRPSNHRPRASSPERSLMQSKHATTAAQDKLDANKLKSSPPLPVISSTEVTPEPLPVSTAGQDTPLPDAPSAAPAGNDGWMTVKAKATQKKKRKAEETILTAATSSNTPTAKNDGRGKNIHQPSPTTPSAQKTWAEVVRSGGINVQIALGNGNL
ncbi:hypothetical protein BZA77DRAFT_361608 [Pyronema omphalodes]|nr:hypothetical protein BZA77DRAFT_361608 [Pyronema omphalodes]